MRLHELTESVARYRTKLGRDQAIQIARSNYLSFFKMFHELPPIYRGASGGEITIVNPAHGGGRSSANTSNEYTILMSELPSWQAFPKRTHSIICTTDAGKASNYGDGTFVVAMQDRFRLGVCSESDVWFSFPYLSSQTGVGGGDHFNQVFDELVGMATDDQHWYADGYTTLEEISHKCDEIQSYLNHTALEEFHFNELALYLSKKIPHGTPAGAVFDTIVHLFDPKLNSFKLYTKLLELHSLPEGPEVWTDTPCMLVPIDDWEVFSDEVLRGG